VGTSVDLDVLLHRAHSGTNGSSDSFAYRISHGPNGGTNNNPNGCARVDTRADCADCTTNGGTNNNPNGCARVDCADCTTNGGTNNNPNGCARVDTRADCADCTTNGGTNWGEWGTIFLRLSDAL
jgi:hypothetical protein